MKKTQMMLAALTVALALPVFGADAPKASASDAVKDSHAAKEAEKPVTYEEVLAFLPNVLAEVNGQKITKKDLISLLQTQGAQPAVLKQIPDDILHQLIQQPISRLIDNRVFMEMAKKAGYIPSEEFVKKELDSVVSKMSPEQKKILEERLKAEGKTLDQYREEISKKPAAQQDIAMDAFFREKFAKPAKDKVADADAEKFYRENQQYFEKPTISVSHIVAVVPNPDDPSVKPEEIGPKDKAAKAKIEGIAAKLKQGAKFDDLVKESDEPGAAERKGKLPEFTTQGIFEQGRMDGDFVKACLDLKKPGDISGIVKTQFGYHIIRLDEKKPQTFEDFAKVKDQIKIRLTQEKISAELKKAVEEARKTMKIVNYTIKQEPASAAPAPKK